MAMGAKSIICTLRTPNSGKMKEQRERRRKRRQKKTFPLEYKIGIISIDRFVCFVFFPRFDFLGVGR
jgi:hypothetical protein